MPVIITPYIPRTITVHLGAPSQNAENVTVDFPDYIKNVASSEIYPTWEPAALRANILAQISFALNRVYTEFYPSRGYNFQITSTTAMDQKFIFGRNIFENISQIVDQIFDDYIRRQGFAEPLSAKFCNGTTTTCDGLSQWGSQALAEEGLDSMSILRRYYGDDIELVVNAPVQDLRSSYPGTPLRLGSSSTSKRMNRRTKPSTSSSSSARAGMPSRTQTCWHRAISASSRSIMPRKAMRGWSLKTRRLPRRWVMCSGFSSRPAPKRVRYFGPAGALAPASSRASPWG